jgi:hypothetical protein
MREVCTTQGAGVKNIVLILFLENMSESDHLGDTSIYGDNIKMELKE